ncbi:MAG: tetratricopeptide repeat protein [Blastocatellia bacterium]
MKSRAHFIASLLLAAAFAAAPVLTGAGAVCLPEFQQGVGKGPITVPRDPELEKQSYHSLEVAKFYYTKRRPDKNDKAGWERLNKSVEGRLTEIMDTNPAFARMDEVYFFLGEVYKRMGDVEKAIDHWNKALKETSDDKIKSESQKRLDEAKSREKK